MEKDPCRHKKWGAALEITEKKVWILQRYRKDAVVYSSQTLKHLGSAVENENQPFGASAVPTKNSKVILFFKKSSSQGGKWVKYNRLESAITSLRLVILLLHQQIQGTFQPWDKSNTFLCKSLTSSFSSK